MMGELGVFGRIGQVVLIIVNLLFAVSTTRQQQGK
jgi:hypothetical protein